MNSIDSANMPAQFRLAVDHLKAGRYRDALDVTLAAAKLAPGGPAELIELAKRLMYFNQSGPMRELATRLLSKPVWHAAAEADFAALLSMTGEQALAASLLDRAIAVIGATPAAIYNRSQMHLYSGRMAAAEADLRQCLRLEPGMTKAYWALSKLPKTAATTQELSAMRALASRVAAGSQDEVFLRFALFNRLDQLERHDQAWQELARGCQAKRHLVAYDADATRRFFAALLQLPAAPPAGPMRLDDAACTVPEPRCWSASWAAIPRSRRAANSTIFRRSCVGRLAGTSAGRRISPWWSERPRSISPKSAGATWNRWPGAAQANPG